MLKNNIIKICIAVLVLVAVACSCFNTPVTTAPIPTSTTPANTICGWIENSSTTGAMSPVMTVEGTGRILKLYNLESDAIAKFDYVSPAYFRVYDPVYQDPDLLVNFSRIEQVPNCPQAPESSIPMLKMDLRIYREERGLLKCKFRRPLYFSAYSARVRPAAGPKALVLAGIASDNFYIKLSVLFNRRSQCSRVVLSNG